MIVREVPGDGADRSRQGALLPAEKREREEEEENADATVVAVDE